MAVRLALLGVALIVLGVVNVGGYGVITTAVGAAALVGAGVVWTVPRVRGRRTRGSRREPPGLAAGERAADVRPRSGMGQLRTLLPGLVVSGVVPLLVYLLLRPYLAGDTSALAVALAVPVVYTIIVFGWRRRIDPVGLCAVVGFAIALLVVVASDGNTFALKLQEAVVTGPVGLALLISAAVRHPLLAIVADVLGKRGTPGHGAVRRHSYAVLTVILGCTLVAHAVTLTVFALALPTVGVLALSRLVGLSIIAMGAAVLLWYRSRLQLDGRVSGPGSPPPDRPGAQSPDHAVLVIGEPQYRPNPARAHDQ